MRYDQVSFLKFGEAFGKAFFSGFEVPICCEWIEAIFLYSVPCVIQIISYSKNPVRSLSKHILWQRWVIHAAIEVLPSLSQHSHHCNHSPMWVADDYCSIFFNCNANIKNEINQLMPKPERYPKLKISLQTRPIISKTRMSISNTRPHWYRVIIHVRFYERLSFRRIVYHVLDLWMPDPFFQFSNLKKAIVPLIVEINYMYWFCDWHHINAR